MFFCGYKLGQHLSSKRFYDFIMEHTTKEHDKIIKTIDEKLNDENDTPKIKSHKEK